MVRDSLSEARGDSFKIYPQLLLKYVCPLTSKVEFNLSPRKPLSAGCSWWLTSNKDNMAEVVVCCPCVTSKTGHRRHCGSLLTHRLSHGSLSLGHASCHVPRQPAT